MKNTTASGAGVALVDHQATSSRQKRQRTNILSQRRHSSSNASPDLPIRIERLKRLGEKLRSGRGSRYSFYRFLRAAFDLRSALKENETKELRRLARSQRNHRHSSACDEFGMLINLCSYADRKSKSRWSQALRYAYRRRKRWQSNMTLMQFFGENGGVAGCARLIAKARKPKCNPKRYWA